MKRIAPDSAQLFGEFRDLGLVAQRVVWIGSVGPKLKRIVATHAVNVEQPLGLDVIGLEYVIAHRPGRRDAAGVDPLAEVTLAQPEECCAIDFGIAADIVVKRRAERVSLGVRPGLVGLICAIDEYRL